MAGGEGRTGPIRVHNNKRRSLGPEWSMSEVGTPPPHNLDKPHGLVASINNNSNNRNFDGTLDHSVPMVFVVDT